MRANPRDEGFNALFAAQVNGEARALLTTILERFRVHATEDSGSQQQRLDVARQPKRRSRVERDVIGSSPEDEPIAGPDPAQEQFEVCIPEGEDLLRHAFFRRLLAEQS